MMVLALDLATTTGWALGEVGGTPKSGSLRFAKAGHSMGAHFAGCRDWLNDFVAVNNPKVVVFEGPLAPSFVAGRTNTDTVRLLMGLIAVVEATLYGREFDVREAQASRVREFFIGSNRITRKDAKLATKRRCFELGWGSKTDDEADACALWLYQCAVFEPKLAVQHTPLFGGRAWS